MAVNFVELIKGSNPQDRHNYPYLADDKTTFTRIDMTSKLHNLSVAETEYNFKTPLSLKPQKV